MRAVMYGSGQSKNRRESADEGNAMKNTQLFERIYGCMIGGAVGDAMGFPTETFHYKLIREKYGKIDNPRTREGCENSDPPVNGPVYTDDRGNKRGKPGC